METMPFENTAYYQSVRGKLNQVHKVLACVYKEKKTYADTAKQIEGTLGKVRYIIENQSSLLEKYQAEIDFMQTVYYAYISGMSTPTIAKHCFCSTTKVTSTLKKLNVTKKEGGVNLMKQTRQKAIRHKVAQYSEKNIPFSYIQLADEYGISPSYAWILANTN